MLIEYLTRRQRHDKVWALRDVSFDVRKGEILGIVGRNGAGKSTLLKILAGTLDRTSGSLHVAGRISAILELGTGFHADYTGRENVILGGMCLGSSRQEMARKLDSIVDFAELRHVIDYPFKTYSSGMQARLTFATAISIEPEILIIDEALAVGDVFFQEKCFRRIRDIVSRGATVLFVTHNYLLLYDLCSRAVLLNGGRLLLDGSPREVGYLYENLVAEERGGNRVLLSIGEPPPAPATRYDVPPPRPAEAASVTATPGRTAELTLSTETTGSAASAAGPDQAVEPGEPPPTDPSPPGAEWASIVDGGVFNSRGVEVRTLHYGESYTVRVRALCLRTWDRFSIGYMIQRVGGHVVFGWATAFEKKFVPAAAGEIMEVAFNLDCKLGANQHFLSLAISRMKGDIEYEVLQIVREAALLTIVSSGTFQGDVDLGSRVQSIVTHPADQTTKQIATQPS